MTMNHEKIEVTDVVYQVVLSFLFAKQEGKKGKHEVLFTGTNNHVQDYVESAVHFLREKGISISCEFSVKTNGYLFSASL